MRRLAVSLVAATMLLAPMAAESPAALAAQNTAGDSLVNVQVGNIAILEAVNVGVAANVVAAICGTQVALPVGATVLSEVTLVDANNTQWTACNLPSGQDLVVAQNTSKKQ